MRHVPSARGFGPLFTAPGIAVGRKGRGKYAKAMAWLQKAYQYQPGLFAHWQLIAFT